MKKTVRVALQLLLLSFFLFVGHRVYVHLLEDPYFRVREVEVEGMSEDSERDPSFPHADGRDAKPLHRSA